MPLDTTLSPLTYSGLQITDVTVELPTSSSKWVQSLDIQIDGESVNGRLTLKGTLGTSRTMTVTLEPPRIVVLSLQLTAHLRYRNIVKQHWRSQEISVNVQELLAVKSTMGKTEWRGTFGKVVVIVGLTTRVAHPMERAVSVGSTSIRNASMEHDDGQPLTPTTESILRDCPRFRILVMGKTGVGKSRLINKTFGVDDAIVSDREAGFADIDKEILSKQNPHFILHDSKGFEQGDDANVKIVQRFINERSKMPLIKDKLHAVWLCIDIPIAGGRLLETGIEQFLKLKIEGKLGHVPVIAVFTKYDLLVVHEDRMFRRAERAGKTKEEIATLIADNANTILEETCVEPFDKFVEMKVPHVTVSAEYGYEARLSDLIQVTYERVRDYFVDASVVSAMAQRVNPRVNIQASIAVGRRKYWERLANSVNFPGKKLQECLNVIHTDIIAVWQLDDPNGYLSSSDFKALMSNIVSNEGVEGEKKSKMDPGKSLVAGISVVAGVVGIVSAVSGPVAPIVIPIAASFVLAKWAYDVYQQTTVVLRLLMTYIIDLTLILQNIFWLQALTGYGRPLSRRIIKAGARAYYESNIKQTISFKIDKHLKGVSFNVGPDTTIKAIVELIDLFTIDSAEMLEQRSSFSIPEEQAGADEAWEEI